ncbi:hypothetical protein K440DRAFT_636544 [Wilcoxina mikolae CBS 423.85]|nr:hypothetical protein K440DRAFT_636544 [Wilcoxina mikolae CBS 423.85]
MSSLITSSKHTFNKTKWGVIPQLSHTNYNECKDDMIFILSANRAYEIFSGDNAEPQPLDIDYDDWKAEEVQAACIIKLSCSPEVLRIIKGIRNSHEMWNMLETSLDTAGLYIGRQDILRHFHTC